MKVKRKLLMATLLLSCGLLMSCGGISAKDSQTSVIAESEQFKAKTCRPIPPPAPETLDLSNKDLVIIVLTQYGVSLNGVISDCISAHDARDKYIMELKRRLE